MDTSRIAVLGAGLIGREHCALLGAHPDVDIAGIADPAPAAAALANELGTGYYPEYQSLLDGANPDGVIIALPNALHEAAALACIAEGLPCLIEKPVADTVSAASRIAQAAEAAGVPVLVGHHRRHSPDIRAARRAVLDGLLGDIVAVNGLWLADKPDDYFDNRWRWEPGGGPVLINLIHDIDCLRFMVGEIESVVALGSHDVRGFAVEDGVSIAMRFETGALGSFLLSDAVASPFTWEMSSGQALYFPDQPVDCYQLGGRKGTLSVPSMKLWRHGHPAESWQDPLEVDVLNLDGSRAYENQLAHFLDVTQRRAPPVVSARDATVTLAATKAVLAAMDTGRTILMRDFLAD